MLFTQVAQIVGNFGEYLHFVFVSEHECVCVCVGLDYCHVGSH